ncbi:MAG: gluconeogenesis factor YvcK family protein [Desulfobacterales bacterium]|nr:gluconeogenesis factor YvcK family protein [Desulfobacterales bacterium]
MANLKVTTIGGGSGQYALLSGLRDVAEIEITAIVSMVDSGGSTGRLRDELGILPPGDVLKCLLALSPQREIARTLLLRRFERDKRLMGHNAGNMLLTMLSRYTGSFPTGIQALGEILNVQGVILPVTTDRATLVAELTDGKRIFGESAIDVPRGGQASKIKDVYLVPHHSGDIKAYPPVIEAINAADYIIIGPGDLFTSILSNIVVPGVKTAIMQTKATIVYVLNIMTKYGETHNYTGIDFIRKLEEGIGRTVQIAICNRTQPQESILAQYRKQEAEFVEIINDQQFWQDRKLILADLLDTSGSIVRHDAKKLARLIQGLMTE